MSKKILKVVSLAAVLLFCTGGLLGNSADAWKDAASLVENIKKVSFPDKEYLITDYGASIEAFDHINAEAINKAIVTCSNNGGGRVVVPAGRFVTGPVTLKSNVNLHLEEGAVLAFTTDETQYFPAVLTRWEGLDCYNTRPLIYAYGETNVAITGKGTIDGQASKENWWSWNGNPRYGWQEGMKSQKGGSRAQLLEWGETFAPIYTRIMTAEDALRPQLINLYLCERILIQDVTLLNSPFWVIHPLMCNDMIVKGVTIVSHGPNSDGCDPESSKNVLIEDCFFDTGDDCIAIKSGRNQDGRKWNIPSENIVVRNCRMKNGHGGVVIGSEISGGYRNLYVENCEMDSPLLDRVIRIKTNNCRGGIIENVFVRNIKVGQCKEAVLKINLDYENREVCDRSFPPIVRNVHLDNVTCQKSSYGVLITGLQDLVNVTNVSITDSEFNNVKTEYKITGASDVRFDNVVMDGKKVVYP